MNPPGGSCVRLVLQARCGRCRVGGAVAHRAHRHGRCAQIAFREHRSVNTALAPERNAGGPGRSIRLRIGLALAILCSTVLLSGQTGTILSVEFDGNLSIDSAQLRSSMRYMRVGIPYRPALLAADVENVRRCYLDEGFLKVDFGEPRVELRSEGGKDTGISIRIRVTEGPQYLLGDLTVSGNTLIATETLLQMAPVRPGQPISRRKLEEWREKAAEGYRSMGYIRFDGELSERTRDVLRRVDVSLVCREGQEYRVRRINVAGDPPVDPAAFKRRLLVGEGGVFNPEMLVLSRLFLNQSGLYRPIRESDVQVTIDDASAAVDITIRVSPIGKPD